MSEHRKEERKHQSLSDVELTGIADRMYENFKKDIFMNAGKGFLGFIGRLLIAAGVGFAGYYIGTSMK